MGTLIFSNAIWVLLFVPCNNQSSQHIFFITYNHSYTCLTNLSHKHNMHRLPITEYPTQPLVSALRT